MKGQIARFEKIFAILLIVFILFIIFIVGIKSILVVGTDIVFWILFLVLLVFSFSLVIDFAYILFSPIQKYYIIKRNIGLSTWPTFDSFKTGRSNNSLEDFFVLLLRGKFLDRYGREPNGKSFGDDESIYLSFRRDILPQAVLFSRFRPFVEDLYMKIYRLYRTKQLDTSLREILEDSMKLSGRKRFPFLAIYTIIRFLLMVFSFGKLKLPKRDTYNENGVRFYEENPKAFIELMDEHFFSIFGDVTNLLKAREISEKTTEKTRKKYKEDVETVRLFSAPSSSSRAEAPREEKKTEPENPKQSSKAKEEPKKKSKRDAKIVFEEIQHVLESDGEHWENIGAYLEDALLHLHGGLSGNEDDYKLLARLQVYKARLGTFEDDLNSELEKSAGADSSFEADWLKKAVQKMPGGFAIGEPAFERLACRFYLFDEQYHTDRGEH